MKKRRTLIIGGTFMILSVIAWMVFRPHTLQNLTGQYDFFTVKRMDLSEKIDTTGMVLALEKKDLYADYDGAVEKVNVKAGDYVKKGDILISITSSVLKEQWQDAKSALKQAQVNLNQAATQLATEVALNHVSTTNALQLENHYHQVALAKEQVSQAQQRLEALSSKNDGYYVSNNEKLFIRAPFDSQVAWINVNQGDKISAQTILVTVMKPDNLGVEALIDQNDINAVKVGQKVIVTGKDQGQTLNPGLVTEISVMGQNEVTTGQTTTGSTLITNGVVNFPVRIKLENNSKGLQPGMSVDVTVLANEHSNVLALPASSVIEKNGHTLVNIRRKNQVILVSVQLGFKHGKFWEVTAGLKVGDQVAVPKPVLAKQPTVPGAGQRKGVMAFGR